jgi:hypothetical protein
MLKKTYLWLFGLALLSPNLPAKTDCDNVTQIPAAECEALLAFYDSTNGEGWANHEKWNKTNRPCKWYGVACKAKNVSSIELADNQLNGIIPKELGELTSLEQLSLNDNDLCEDIPPELANLSNISGLSLDNNHLTDPGDPDLTDWLNQHNPNWADTQTPCAEPGTLQFSKAKYKVNENDGSVEITVERVDGSDGAISVEYKISGGTATAGEDYVKTKGTLDWGDGDADDKTITVTILDDTIVEDNETFKLRLKKATGGASIGDPGKVIIVDDDLQQVEPGTLQFSSATYSVDENGGSVIITVSRVNGSDGDISVKYTSSDGTAMAGEDYTKTKGILNWSDGDADDKTITVPILDDTIFEGDETFNMRLKKATGGATIGDPDTVVVTIVDEPDISCLQFSSATYTVDEGEYATITVMRVSDGAISVDYNSSDGTATAGEDYPAFSGTLNFRDGGASDKTIAMPTFVDAVQEGDETFYVTLSNATGGATICDPGTAVVTIVDDWIPNPGILQFSSATYSVDENGGYVTLTVSRLDGSDGAISVDYISSDGSATAGEDYTAGSGTLNFHDGDANDKTFAVPILDDTIVEGNESFSLTLSNATDGATIGDPDTAEVIIVDDDTPPVEPGTLQFSEATYSVDENGGYVTITVTRQDGDEGAISVDYATSDDTAIAGSDYIAKADTLDWTDGDSVDKTFTIDIIDDSEPENDETLIVSLGNVTGGAELGMPNVAVVTITGNDPTICTTVTEIPPEECEALVAIYNSTNGEHWKYNTGWLVTNTPCSWYGMKCKNGQVTRLYLQYNQLTGFIPPEIEGLSNLEVLNMKNNDLCEDIPVGLMNLEHLWSLKLDNNHLTASDPDLRAWLDQINPGWDTTQTPCP